MPKKKKSLKKANRYVGQTGATRYCTVQTVWSHGLVKNAGKRVQVGHPKSPSPHKQKHIYTNTHPSPSIFGNSKTLQ